MTGAHWLRDAFNPLPRQIVAAVTEKVPPRAHPGSMARIQRTKGLCSTWACSTWWIANAWAGCCERTVRPPRSSSKISEGFGCVWDLKSDQGPLILGGHATSVIGLAFSPDGNTLATGSYDTFKLWKVPTFQEVAIFPTERAVLRGLRFSPDGNTLAAGYLPFTGASTATTP